MSDKKTQRFTFDTDHDGAEVPTLTSLLYKKNVVKSGASGGNPARPSRQEEPSQILSLDPTVTVNTGAMGHPPEVVISPLASTRAAPAPSGSAASSVELRVVPAPLTSPATGLRAVQPQSLPQSAAASGIQYLFKNGRLLAALVFRSKDPDTLALSDIAGAPSDRASTWEGMEFQRRDFTDLLGRLDKFGFAEFSTLGMAGQGNFDRIAFRTAFQAKGAEWVTLVRVQHPSEKESIVVVLSEGSVQALLPGFHSACLGGQAKAA